MSETRVKTQRAAFGGWRIFDCFQAYLPGKSGAAGAGRQARNVARVGLENGALNGRCKRRSKALHRLCLARSKGVAAVGFMAVSAAGVGR
jgi:hypothetical protein